MSAGYVTVRARENLVRILWAQGRDSLTIQRIVSAGDKERGVPPCDARTVRTYLNRLRAEMERQDADAAPHFKSQLRGILRANLNRAHVLHDRAMKAGQLQAAGRALQLVNQTTDRLAALDGLNDPVRVEVTNESGVALAGAVPLPNMRELPPAVREAIVAVAKAAKEAAAVQASSAPSDPTSSTEG